MDHSTYFTWRRFLVQSSLHRYLVSCLIPNQAIGPFSTILSMLIASSFPEFQAGFFPSPTGYARDWMQCKTGILLQNRYFCMQNWATGYTELQYTQSIGFCILATGKASENWRCCHSEYYARWINRIGLKQKQQPNFLYYGRVHLVEQFFHQHMYYRSTNYHSFLQSQKKSEHWLLAPCDQHQVIRNQLTTWQPSRESVNLMALPFGCIWKMTGFPSTT